MFNSFTKCLLLWCCVIGLGNPRKYRICVVDGKGHFKKSIQYCPTLDHPESPVECVVALDRLDCLRRISKNTADFSIFTPEDLITATNEQLELIVTNDLRFTREPNEYEVVAIVRDSAGIKDKHDLRDSKFCHPGYGYEADWTNILSNFFEASVVPPVCDPQLSMTENRIKATSQYFKAACKAGPWTNNPLEDAKLKLKYSNLCSLCGNDRCSIQDKYWGRRGSLFCLTDGSGDVSWARLDDVQVHFGLTSGGFEEKPEGYSFLCPDNTLIPLNSSKSCVWVVKPWNVIATARTSSEPIQRTISQISYNDQIPWKASLFNLISSSHLFIEELNPVQAIESYLDNAKGFLSANSFSGCHPPRTINICAPSILDTIKCSWMRESAGVYGLEPDLECIKADNQTHCMMALSVGIADVTMAPADLLHVALKTYNLKPLFYESTSDDHKYITVAVTKANSQLTSWNDLRGAKACFPNYDGIAWNSVFRALQQNLSNFFKKLCIYGHSDLKQCHFDVLKDDLAALFCLTTGQGDVAFVSQNSIKKFVQWQKDSEQRLKDEDFKVLCRGPACYLSWAPLSYGLIRQNSSKFWSKDTLNVFLQLDDLFGKNYKQLTNSFSLFGPYDGHEDVLFHDQTVKLNDVPELRQSDHSVLSYEDLIKNDFSVANSASLLRNISSLLIVISLLEIVRLI